MLSTSTHLLAFLLVTLSCLWLIVWSGRILRRREPSAFWADYYQELGPLVALSYPLEWLLGILNGGRVSPLGTLLAVAAAAVCLTLYYRDNDQRWPHRTHRAYHALRRLVLGHA